MRDGGLNIFDCITLSMVSCLFSPLLCCLVWAGSTVWQYEDIYSMDEQRWIRWWGSVR